MAAFFLIVSAVLFIGTFGIYALNHERRRTFDQPLIFRYPGVKAIPWICGFILPVVPLAVILPYHWFAIFAINIPVVFIAGPLLTQAFLVIFRSSRGHVYDMIKCIVGGVVTLVIGLILAH